MSHTCMLMWIQRRTVHMHAYLSTVCWLYCVSCEACICMHTHVLYLEDS